MKFIGVTILIGAIMGVTTGWADPSGPIAEMMKTPSTVFDDILYRIYDQSRCYPDALSDKTRDDLIGPCMTRISYEFADNLIIMHFYVSEKYENLAGFANMNDVQKNRALELVMIHVGERVGVVPLRTSSGTYNIGLIYSTPIRNGWSADGFDEKSARDEIAARAVMRLATESGGILYTIVRDQHGKITYEKVKS